MVNWFIKFFHKEKKPGEQPAQATKKPEEKKESPACWEEFTKLFEGDATFLTRPVMCGDVECCIAFIDGMVSNELINRSIIVPLLDAPVPKGEDIKQWLEKSSVAINEMKYITQIEQMLDAVLSGDTVLFARGMPGAFDLNTKGFQSRSIDEPDMEKVTRGSHEGFTENIMVNLSLLRRRLKTPDLKTTFRKVGTRTNTRICICYLDTLVDKSVLEELNQRLDKINIDGILASNYIEELITDSRLSLFRTIGYTERPDITAARLLEGRVAIFVDGTPAIITMPFLFVEYFQSNQDYYEQSYSGTTSRLLRIIGFLLTLITPPFYVALVTLHQEMIPSGLLLAINAARQQVPLPTMVEVLALLFAFDILRESGQRLPSYLGQSLSIVGGLVIGQAAVSARIISAPVVIVVAFAATTSLIIPKLNMPVMILRLVLILLANFYGIYGIAFGLMGLLIHLLGMRSFGVPYMQGTMPLSVQDAKDTVVRLPWWMMRMRPRNISTQDNVRQSSEEDQ